MVGLLWSGWGLKSLIPLAGARRKSFTAAMVLLQGADSQQPPICQTHKGKLDSLPRRG